MAAHGATPHAALSAVLLVIQAHVNYDTLNQRTPLSRLSEAPRVYWDALEKAKPLAPPKQVFAPAIVEARITQEPLAVN